MNVKSIHNVYFIGIGGIGMSALARYFTFLKKNVAGYDKVQTPLTNELKALGVAIHFDDNVDSIPNTFKNSENTLVVYTPAIPKNHSEKTFFDRGGFEIKKRAEVLGMITKETICLAVAGTHGKTACVTSMDADHLDIYGDGEALTASFNEFVGQVKPDGKLVVCNGLQLKGLTYGIEDDSDYCAQHIRIENGTYIFDIKTPSETIKEVRFNKPGRHNLLNGLAAYTMAVQVIPQPHRLAMCLSSFKGVQRRFSYQIKEKDFVFIDDYAHHPTEIDAVYQAVTEMHPNTLRTVVFQPHLFSRTRDFADAFAKSLSPFDCVLLLEIYPAREAPIEGIDATWLLEKIDNPNKKLLTIEINQKMSKRFPLNFWETTTYISPKMRLINC